MSTRSGKRIHNSYHEDNIMAVDDMTRSERKTRSKHLKENLDIINATEIKPKKRKNYVKYPSDQEINDIISGVDEVEAKGVHILPGNTLKEQNILTEANLVESTKKYIRSTRRTKKVSENETERDLESNNNKTEMKNIAEKSKVKKNKKKDTVKVLGDENVKNLNKNTKKKKGRKLDSQEEELVQKSQNTSLDSFYSTEDSPNRELNPVKNMCNDIDASNKPICGFSKNSIVEDKDKSANITSILHKKNKNAKKYKMKSSSAAFEATTQRKKLRNCLKEVFPNQNINTTYDNDVIESDTKKEDLTFDKDNEDITFEAQDVHTVCDQSKKRKSLINTTFDKDISINENDVTFDMDISKTVLKRNSVVVNAYEYNDKTFEQELDEFVNKNNTSVKGCIFNKDTSNVTEDKITNMKKNTPEKNCYETEKNNLTFNKETNESPRKSTIKDTTFEKSSSSLIDVDNVTFDKDSSNSEKAGKRNCFTNTKAKYLSEMNAAKESFKEKTFDKINNSSKKRKSIVENTTILKNNEIDISKESPNKNTVKDATFEKENTKNNTFNINSNEKPNKRTKSYIENHASKSENEKIFITDEPSNKTPEKDATFEKDNCGNSSFDMESNQKSIRKKLSLQRNASMVENNKIKIRDESPNKVSAHDATFEKENGNSTFDMDSNEISKRRESSLQRNASLFENNKIKITDDTSKKTSNSGNNTFDIDSNKKPIRRKSYIQTCASADESLKNMSLNDTTFEKEDKSNKRKQSILRRNSTEINIAFTNQNTSEKNKITPCTPVEIVLNETFDKTSKSSLISSDESTADHNTVPGANSFNDISSISITSDESENIVNTTPVLVESSIDESLNPTVQTPLKREGTFTKDSATKDPATPNIPSISPTITPRKPMSLMSAGCTPLHPSGAKNSVMNVTRSLEKERTSSVNLAPRVTKVMFCSPVFDPVVASQQKRKVIKSNLKGSNKSFVFEESAASSRPAPRKRSYTQSDADDNRVKRTRLADCQQQSVDRLSRPRTSSASAKLADPATPSKKTPQKTKPDAKTARTKLPNFAALHRKQFDQMESLDECQQRKARRAKQLLTPTGAISVIERSSPKGPVPEQQKQKEPTKTGAKKPLPTLDSLRPGYTRFGFKLDMENNPFCAPRNIEKSKNTSKILPSLSGSTARKEVAKQVVMRERSFTDRRVNKRNENRTIIKGVRTNRRFELQMKMRNID